LAFSACLVVLGCVALWWRLGNGPIQLDVVTPWLASAIEENFGSSHHVEVGGTQIERTENGDTAVRIATSWCATPTVRWWRARQKRKSTFPA
jgi:hypothetical protein